MQSKTLELQNQNSRRVTMAKINSLTPILDTDSPYYLNPDCYNLTPANFSIDKLSDAEDNYVIWKCRFLDFLEFTNKTGFVDGTIEKPDTSSPLYQSWKQCNALVKLWLMNSVTDKVANTVLRAETAQKAWEDLRRRFVPSVDMKIYQIRRRLAMLRQGNDSVTKYYGKLSKAWMELSEYDPLPTCECGGCSCEITKKAEEAREKEERYAFLMGLNKDLDFVRTQIMVQKNPPPVHQAFIMVEQAESMMKRN